jgi:hypothetical protein
MIPTEDTSIETTQEPERKISSGDDLLKGQEWNHRDAACISDFPPMWLLEQRNNNLLQRNLARIGHEDYLF